MGAIFVLISAIVIKMVLVGIVTAINDKPLDALPFANMIFLMFQRPLFVIAGALGFSPILLRNPFTYPLTAFLEHQFWYPLARLSYGAYLSHGIFMLFRTFNMERGMWACEIDAFFLFMAYLSFAYLFSFMITIMVEMPCHNMYQTFIMGVSLRPDAQTNFDHAYQRQSSKGKRVTLSSSEDDVSDAETLDTAIDDDSQGYAINNSSGSSKKKTTAYAHARKGSSKFILDDADAAPAP